MQDTGGGGMRRIKKSIRKCDFLPIFVSENVIIDMELLKRKIVTETISVTVNDELKGSIAEPMPVPLQCLPGLLTVALPKGDADVFS